MEQFYNYMLESECDRIRLNTELLLEFPNASEEDFLLGTPKCWDDTLLERIEINHYDIYFLCAHTVSKDKVSRITDYKKVWGLKNLSLGIYENAYDNEQDRVYFGIVKTAEDKGFYAGISPLLLLIPKGQSFSLEQLFACFAKEKYNFSDNLPQSLISRIKQITKEAILLHYQIFPKISLSIYGKDVQMLFNEQDCFKWEKHETIAVYKAFL